MIKNIHGFGLLGAGEGRGSCPSPPYRAVQVTNCKLFLRLLIFFSRLIGQMVAPNLIHVVMSMVIVLQRSNGCRANLEIVMEKVMDKVFQMM